MVRTNSLVEGISDNSFCEYQRDHVSTPYHFITIVRMRFGSDLNSWLILYNLLGYEEKHFFF